MKTLTVIPAYGRDYTVAASAEMAWNDGLDFKIPNGPYVGRGEKERLLQDGYTHVCIRYYHQRKSVTFALEGE